MDKEQVKASFIDYLNNKHDVNKQAQFVGQWVWYKMPEIDKSRIVDFVNRFISHLYQPFPQIDMHIRCNELMNNLIETARLELEVNSIVKTENYQEVIKYY